jgi:acyl-CoA reductase-like NAD-dependent aldehyde dehydrogenase
MSPRRPVVKTYKLLIGGAFVRSESGRSDVVTDHAGVQVGNVPRGSRKDVRDAVKAARGAFGKWSARTAYNRGQILYRMAEALESRSVELAARSAALRGLERAAARREVEAAVDATVHYAGWTDKLHAVLGSVHPLALPYFGFSLPEPTGVVVVLAPDEPDVLGLVAELLPPLAAGNTVVALVSERYPLAPLDLGEVLEVSDVPAGVVNLISGRRSELVPQLAGHRDVNAILDATGDDSLRARIDELGAETVKRVSRRDGIDYLADPSGESLGRIEPFVELKTAWHPVGA